MQLNMLIVEDIIKGALKEDINYMDMTTDILIDISQKSRAVFTAKAPGVLCGVEVAVRTFQILDPSIKVTALAKDGDLLSIGQDFLTVEGSTRAILKAERTALNLMQRMSGIATLSKEYSDLVEGTGTRIADTRKTTPLLRVLEKYSVSVGGAFNHRYNLSDAVMIKDNHIEAVGSITQAVKAAKNAIPHTMKVEIEVKNLDEYEEALGSGADVIMLDNMSLEDMKEAVNRKRGNVILEASGGVNKDTVKNIALTGVDIISVGALTHSYKSLDISLNIK